MKSAPPHIKPRDRARNKYRVAMAEAERRSKLDPLPSIDPVSAIQWIIDRLYNRLVHASTEVDKLRPGQLTVMTAFGPTDHEWVRAEHQLTAQLARVCSDAAKIGLAERMLNIEEAKAQLILRAFTAAAIDCGIDRDQLRSIAPKFREHLGLLQGAEPEAEAA